MNERLESKIDELYNLLMGRPLKVLDIFNDFFGENRVDMQGFPSADKFKMWLGITNISEYMPRAALNMSEEDYNIYGRKALTELNDETLDRVMEILCSNGGVIESIRTKKFNQGFILVHFPYVRVTNEYDRYVDINHLYAKVVVNSNGSGNGYFTLNRAEYTYLHISNNYMHSHVSNIPTSNFTDFQSPCTGSGPINDTLSSLARDFDEDLWRLFCLELDKYVQVESIAGTPYHRLEQLGTANMYSEDSTFKALNVLGWYEYFSKDMAKSFTEYLIRDRKLKFNYKSGSYSIGMTFVEFMVLISNEFISWYNQKFNEGTYTYTLDDLLRDKVIGKGVIAGDKIYYGDNGRSLNTYRSFVGKRMCTFKGRDVLINITGMNEVANDNESILLNSKIALYILTRILNVVNYRYGKSEQRDQEGHRISGKVRYF